MKRIVRYFLFMSVALLVAATLEGQHNPKVIFGIKGGMNVANFVDNLDPSEEENVDIKVKFGYNIGVTIDYEFIEHLFLLTGLEFSAKGAKIETSYILDESSDLTEGLVGQIPNSGLVKVKYDPMYLAIPIHFGYKVPIASNVKIIFRGGPYIACRVAGKTNITIGGVETEENVLHTEKMKRFDYGFGLGTGLEFGKIGFNLGYDHGIKDIIEVKGVKIKNGNLFYATLGYKF